MKNVQISYDLFVALLQYHLVMDDDYPIWLGTKIGGYGEA